MHLFSHISATRAQLVTHILLKKKQKGKYKLCKINAYGFLRLDKMHHMSPPEFRSINWLPENETAHQCINAITFKLVNSNCPFYLNEIVEFVLRCRTDTRNSFARLKHPFHNTRWGRKPRTLVSLCETIYPNSFKK